jgi:hypothetical protein
VIQKKERKEGRNKERVWIEGEEKIVNILNILTL